MSFLASLDFITNGFHITLVVPPLPPNIDCILQTHAHDQKVKGLYKISHTKITTIVYNIITQQWGVTYGLTI
jgi:hypothetical protein